MNKIHSKYTQLFVRIKVFIDTLGVKAKIVDLIITNNLSRLFCFPVMQQSV